ncbi:hypothetical protein KR51_00011140 [Rubidibacter lacunae KORDI 51-2]|uniref:Uncharacterized protein n=1 Tax=Rubidibacter lacunae KORDI 51-2 TaxID=582515 RepID=U5DR65_9CHRO|nr:hypothetical protein KR51_00011140 [Rubidibacter lacunae KORDI 51-2]
MGFPHPRARSIPIGTVWAVVQADFNVSDSARGVVGIVRLTPVAQRGSA